MPGVQTSIINYDLQNQIILELRLSKKIMFENLYVGGIGRSDLQEDCSMKKTWNWKQEKTNMKSEMDKQHLGTLWVSVLERFWVLST